MIPLISTERFNLIAPSKRCFDVYQKFYTDPQASSMYGGPLNKEETFARLKADLGSWYLLGFGVWVIQAKSDNSFIGTCGFWQGKDWPKELTWWLIHEGRGKGVATEASKAVLLFAYNNLKWSNVKTYMNDENTPARRLVENLGGIKIDRRKFPDGLTRNIYKLPVPN